MKFLITAALAFGFLAATPAAAQVTRTTTTTTVRAPGVVRTVVADRADGTRVVRRTTVRTSARSHSSYLRRKVMRRTLCSVQYRGNKRVRTCRTVRRR